MDAAKKKKGFLKPSTRENFCIYWYNFRSNKLSMVGLAIVVISLIFAIFAPYLENPGQLNTCSTMNALPTIDAMSMPITVITDVLEGLNRYRFIRTFSGRP